jgi:hypothetical protein
LQPITPLITAITPVLTLLGTIIAVYLGHILTSRAEKEKNSIIEKKDRIESLKHATDVFVHVFADRNKGLEEMWQSALDIAMRVGDDRFSGNNEESINDIMYFLLGKIRKALTSSGENANRNDNEDAIQEIRDIALKHISPLLQRYMFKMIFNYSSTKGNTQGCKYKIKYFPHRIKERLMIFWNGSDYFDKKDYRQYRL